MMCKGGRARVWRILVCLQGDASVCYISVQLRVAGYGCRGPWRGFNLMHQCVA